MAARLFLFLLSFQVFADSQVHESFVSDSDSEGAIKERCFRSIEMMVHFDPRFVSRISKQNAVQLAFVSDQYFLDYEYPQYFYGLSSKFRSVCRETAASVSLGLTHFFKKRLKFLLIEQSNTRGFLDEFSLIMKRHTSPTRLLKTLERYSDIEQQYFEKVFADLSVKLKDTRWAYLTEQSVAFERWTEEWQGSFRTAQPAAVWMPIDTRKRNRIALRSLDYSTEVLEILVFHELAHISDSKRFHSSRLEREIYAWQMTFEYLDFLEKNGTVPKEFITAIQNMRMLGLEVWVKSVM